MAAPFVLSVEDNNGDFALIEFVLQECLGAVDLRRAEDGERAVTFLKESANQPRPDLVLLDVNLPRINGFGVLEFIKSQDFIKDVPVIMFTSSRDAREKKQAMELGAEAFITKPTSLDDMLDVLNKVCCKYLGGKTAII